LYENLELIGHWTARDRRQTDASCLANYAMGVSKTFDALYANGLHVSFPEHLRRTLHDPLASHVTCNFSRPKSYRYFEATHPSLVRLIGVSTVPKHQIEGPS
jgi:hypothetical protein